MAGGTRPRAAGRLRAGRDGLAQTAAAAADLLAEGDRAHAGVPTDARDLLLDEISPDPLQPRRHFDEQELRALADDIGRRGVLQPVLVRPPQVPGAPYQLVAGERRWRAARLAGKVRIPARVRELSDEDVQAAQLAENILRTGLTDIEKGRALRRLYEIRKRQNYKVTWEDIAAEVGLGRARIHDLFNLASLPAPIAALIESGRLSGSHGIALQRAQQALSEEQLIQFAEQAARPESKRAGSFRLSVARLRQTIQQNLDVTGAGTSNGGDDGTHAAASAAPPRPFVRRILEALAARTMTDEEQRLLREALTRAHKGDRPREEPDQSGPQEASSAAA